MKKLFFVIALTLCCLSSWAQEKNPNVEALIKEDLFRTGIVLDPYQFIPADETPVPKGYKPFYISHYGRHGSRSDWPADGYRGVVDKFTRAHNAGLLTEQGEKAYGTVSEVFRLYNDMGGRLTPRGAREHRQIAGRMYKKYKKVFRSGSRRVRAISSVSPRCIISMAAFTGELLSQDPKLDIGWDTGDRYMAYISGGDTPEIRQDSEPILQAFKAAHPRDTATFLKNVFKDPAAAFATVGPASAFLDETLDIAVASGAFDCDDSLLRLFSFDDLYWHEQYYSMYMYLRHCNSVEFGDRRMALPEVKAFFQDVADKADEVIANGNYVADLRFGHDTHLLGICSRLGLKGIGERLDAKQCGDWVCSMFAPFAGNLQMIFYRNKAGDVLVKFYLNERETPLISLPGGPYYRWEDVKALFKSF
jgi:hypothetical protein